MDEKVDILKLLQTGTQDDIKALLLTVKIEQVLKVLKTEIIRNKPGATDQVKALFSASKGVEERRYNIYHYVLMLLKQNFVPLGLVAGLICVLLTETETLLTKHLTALTKMFVEALDKGDDLTNRWIEIYPRVLCTLSSRDTVEIDGNSFTGAGFREQAIDNLIMLKWRIYAVPHIVSLFIDLALTSEELLKVIIKCFARLKELDIMDTPVLILHLLRLAEKGHRERVLEGIIQFFIDKDKQKSSEAAINPAEEQDGVRLMEESPERLLEAEGNVILHISMAVEGNIDALRDLLKVLNANKLNQEFVLSPFCLALCLSKKTNNDSLNEFLKTAIFNCYEENINGQKTTWLRSMQLKNFDVSCNFIKTIRNSKEGWDFILENVVDLGLDLIKSYGSKTRVFRCAEEGNYSASDRCCILGQDILLEAYRAHYYVMPLVLEKLLFFMWYRAYPAVLNIIDMIDMFVLAKPRPMIAMCENILRQFIEYLPFLDPKASLDLLIALMPLLKKSVVLKDNLMIVLRKSMFNRKLNARKVSTMGYLLVLKNFKVLGPIPLTQSQESSSDSSSMSQAIVQNHQKKYNCAANEALCYELLSLLKDSLDRQSDNKQIVYECLSDVMVQNPNITSDILELLLNQFDKYFKWNESVCPPIDLKACVEIKMDEPILLEPLGYLIYSICSCITSYKGLPLQDEDDIVSIVKKLETGLESLIKRIISSDLEDFELDKSTEFGNQSSVGIKNQMLAVTLLGVIEVLMDYLFKTKKLDPDSCKDCLSLFGKHRKLTYIVFEKTTAAPGKPKGRKKKDESTDVDDPVAGTSADATVMPPPTAVVKEKSKSKQNVFANRQSLLSIEMISELFQVLFYEPDCDHPDVQDSLKKNESLIRFCLETIEQNIQQFSIYESSEELCKISSSLTRTIMRIYNCEFDDEADTRGKKKKNIRTIPLMCMELVVKITKYFCDLSDKKLLFKFLCQIKSRAFLSQESQVTDSTFLKLSGGLVKTFQKNLVKRLSDDTEEMLPAEKSNFYKEVTYMAQFIALWSCRAECYLKIEEDNDKINPSTFTYKWAKQMCIQQSFSDPQCCSSFVSLYLELSHQQAQVNDENQYLELAKSLRKVIGCIEEDYGSEDDTVVYAVVTEKSANMILQLLIQNMEKIISEISWVLDVVKVGGAGEKGPSIENRCCKRLSHVIFTAEEILHIAVKNGVDIISKFVIKIFNLLINFTKHYIAVYSKRSPKTPPKVCSNFEKLVKLCATNLSPPVLAFISYFEEKMSDAPPSKKPRNSAAETNRVIKETKNIPNLSFALEQFHYFLLTLGKKAKIDFSMHIKSGLSRDFRIDVGKVHENFNEDQDDDNTPEEPPTKRKASGSKSSKKGTKTAEKDANDNEKSSDNSSQATIPIDRSPGSPGKQGTQEAKSPVKSQTAKRGRSKLGRRK